MTAQPVSQFPLPDGGPVFYLWLLVPVGAVGATATLREAYDAAYAAMDEHSDAQASAIFNVHLADDWPYVRFVPHGASDRANHEWKKANLAEARRKQDKRNARRRAARAALRNTSAK
jgi:hypothetical protein